jgi:hypothetical protein
VQYAATAPCLVHTPRERSENRVLRFLRRASGRSVTEHKSDWRTYAGAANLYEALEANYTRAMTLLERKLCDYVCFPVSLKKTATGTRNVMSLNNSLIRDGLVFQRYLSRLPAAAEQVA